MTTEAWIFLACGWGVILVMTGYSFGKMLTSKRQLGDDQPGPQA